MARLHLTHSIYPETIEIRLTDKSIYSFCYPKIEILNYRVDQVHVRILKLFNEDIFTATLWNNERLNKYCFLFLLNLRRAKPFLTLFTFPVVRLLLTGNPFFDWISVFRYSEIFTWNVLINVIPGSETCYYGRKYVEIWFRRFSRNEWEKWNLNGLTAFGFLSEHEFNGDNPFTVMFPQIPHRATMGNSHMRQWIRGQIRSL